MSCLNYTLLYSLIISYQCTVATTQSFSSFSRAFRPVFLELYGIYGHNFMQTPSKCALACLNDIDCVGFYHKGTECYLMTYLWDSNGSGIHDLDPDMCYFYTGEEPHLSDYLFNRRLHFHFKAHDESAKWDIAYKKCQREHAQLVTIKSEAKNKFISKFAVKGLHIGISDLNMTGEWRWLDGSSVGYNKFSPDQPNYYDGRAPNEVALCGAMSKQGVWMDIFCGRKKLFMCEKLDTK